MKPGIYRNMPDAEYRAIPALSHSALMAWATGREIDQQTAEYGSAFHAAILEPDVARAKIVALEPKQRRSSYEGSTDCWVFTNSDYRKLVEQVRVAKEHPQIGKLIELARADRSKCELTMIAVDPDTGLTLKGRIDQVTDRFVYDYKTSGCDTEQFAASVSAFGYDLQAYHYFWLAKECGLGVEGFRFAVSCKRPDKGHVAYLHEPTEQDMLYGQRTRRMLLNLYAKYGAKP